ncbi:MAG: peptide chain release factor 2 [Synergistaceae bacterium]|nr:peptide chain release factor 2 [Synergistaceae bacterium]
MVVMPITTVMADLRSSFDELRESLDPSSLKTRIDELQVIAAEPDFWSSDNAQQVSREISLLQSRLEKIESSQKELLELETLAELLSEVDDEELTHEFYERSSALSKNIKAYQTLVLLDGEYDSGDAIMTIHAGAGGLDSQDWAEMLYRMYMRWAESNKYTVKLIDELPDQEAGIKSVTISISGDYAYGYLKGEQGVHRLVRISPFDSAKRRHTSFASVEVMPVLPDSVEVEIRPEDLKVDTFRSSGAGGQYVNMTDSAIRITHVPSGIVVSCQTERSQHMNRATAMQVLRSKLFEKTLRERQEQLDNIQGEKRTVAWGSQIRSYTLQPFQLIKDHRSGCEIGNVQGVLDGNLDELIMSNLIYLKTGKIQNGSDN